MLMIIMEKNGEEIEGDTAHDDEGWEVIELR